MTEIQKKMIAAAGLKEADFMPKKPVYQRLAEMEKSSARAWSRRIIALRHKTK